MPVQETCSSAKGEKALTDQVRHPDREIFVALYATKLKELRETPYAQRDIRDLERLSERCLQAMERAVGGDRAPLERYVQQVVLNRGQEALRGWHVLLGFEALRDVARLMPGVVGAFDRLDDLLHWATLRFWRLYEETQTEQGLKRMMESLALALDSKEPYTSSHSQSVQKIAEKVARVLGVDIGLAGLFHDIGKINVPDAILTKRSALSDDEWRIVRQHPYHSFRILSPVLPEDASICLRHHERPDGRGYPLGETRFSAEANVVSVADSLHAICSSRSYKGSPRLDFALQEIRARAGTQFFPEVVQAVERRAIRRAGTALSVCFEWETGEEDLRRTRGTTRDISRGGISAFVEDPLPPNMPMRFEVFFPGEQTAGSPLKLYCTGRILRVENHGRRFAVAALIENREVSEPDETGVEPNRRSWKRLSPVPTVVADYPGLRSVVRDLSPSGAFIEDERPFPVGKRFQLRLRSEDTPGEIEVTAVVRRVEPQVGMAVEFVGLSKSANRRLQDCLNNGWGGQACQTRRSSDPPSSRDAARG